MKIYQVETDANRDQACALFWEYLQWANVKVNEEFGLSFDIAEMLEADMLELAKS